MGVSLEPGGGVSVGALAAMWRTVYRKAADAAEARVASLLGDHIQQRHSRRAVAIVLDGGGAPLTTGTKCDLELPWAFVLEGWSLYATAAGSLVLLLQTSASHATFPADLASITGDDPPALSGVDKATDSVLEGWTTALPRGTILRVMVASGGTITGATLTLFVRAL